MSQLIEIVLTLTSIFTICNSLPDLHKQMTPLQLQSVFHVDHVDAVPHYEVVQLLHHNANDGIDAALPAHYRRRRRSIADNSALRESHHVKKDLSKSPYYSELKAAASNAANSVHDAPNSRGKFAGDLRDLKQHNVSFSAFGQHMNLTLRQTQGLFKGGAPHTLRMWTVQPEANATHGLDLQEVHDEDAQSSEQIGEVFQDEANMAAILMRRHLETGDLIMEGSIGHEMVIKPLPHELSPNKEAAHHVVFKRESEPLDHLSDFAFMEPDDLATSEKLESLQKSRQRRATLTDAFADDADADDAMLETDAEADVQSKRHKRQAPYIIYPEVLVIVDYDGYRLHGGDNLQVKRYFISFWNGVDLRYRLLKGPRIRISIAGIIISRGRDATPYLERNRVGRDAIDSAAALTDMGKYLFRERRLPVYDIAVAITKLDMCRRTSAYGDCNRGTAGFAYVGGACVVNKRLEKVNSVAIIEDTGGFSGIIVAAHEVGHLLGAVHDGSPPPSYLGGPGAQRCRWEDGYIMSDLRHTERGFRWSACTVQSFHHFLNGDTATCLHNAPHEDGALGRALPGSLLSLDAQCRRDRGTYACFKDERVCAQLFCFDAQTGYCVAYRPAAEGSSCGNGVQCLDGRCTPLPSNVIPAYRVFNQEGGDSAFTNGEGVDSSSEEEDDDGDEEYNNSSEEEHSNVVNNAHRRVDNSVEVNDNAEVSTRFGGNGITTITRKTVKNTQNDTPTQTNSHTSITLESHTRPKPRQQQQQQHGTFEFLTRFLEQNPQWQQLLGQPVKIVKKMATDTQETSALPTTAAAQEQQPSMVFVKTSVSSSTSSSSGGEKLHESEFGALKTQATTPITTETTSTQNHEQSQSQEIQSQPQTNFLQYYTHEVRKQLQYYLTLLQNNNNTTNSQNSHNNNNKSNISTSKSSQSSSSNNDSNSDNDNDSDNVNSSSSGKIRQFNTATNKNSNYSATTTTGNTGTHKQQQHFNNSNNKHNHNNDDDADANNDDNNNNNSHENDDIDDDVDDGVDGVNDENNETYGKQKRKFDAQQQQHLTTTKTTTATTNTIQGKQKLPHTPPAGKALQRPATTFFDTYFKKLQALSGAAPAPATTTMSTTTTTSMTTTSMSMSTSSSTSTSTTTANGASNSNSNNQSAPESFGAHILKRTLSKKNNSSSSKHNSNDSSHNNGYNSNTHSNNNSYNHNDNDKSNSSGSSHGYSYSNSKKFTRNHHQPLHATAHTQTSNLTGSKKNSNSKANLSAHIAAGAFESTRLDSGTTPSYVTNYLGDDTNNLPAVAGVQQSSAVTATTRAIANSTKTPKIKSQKLIRRQLLRSTQIK